MYTIKKRTTLTLNLLYKKSEKLYLKPLIKLIGSYENTKITDCDVIDQNISIEEARCMHLLDKSELGMFNDFMNNN